MGNSCLAAPAHLLTGIQTCKLLAPCYKLRTSSSLGKVQILDTWTQACIYFWYLGFRDGASSSASICLSQVQSQGLLHLTTLHAQAWYVLCADVHRSPDSRSL